MAFGLDRIVPILPEFMQRHPDLRISLSISDEVANLVEDRIDGAVRMGRLREAGLVSRRLCNLQRVVVASPGFSERNGRPEVPADLARFDCLLWQGAQEHLNRWAFVVDGAPVTIPVSGPLHA